MTFTIKLVERTARNQAEVVIYDDVGNLVGKASGKTRADFTEAVLLDALAQVRGARHLGLKAYIDHTRQPAMPEENLDG